MRKFVVFIILMPWFMTACKRQPNSTTSGNRPSDRLTVFAAASTTDVMAEAGRRYESRTGTMVRFSFDSSANLARQIKAGAPVDLFISADEKWMDDVASAGFIQNDTRENLLGNELVLIAPVEKTFDMSMTQGIDFAHSFPHIQRIAVGDPSFVPAGRYAKQALESMGWWSGLEHRLIPAQDVRAALRLVEWGEADTGIVYATDAKRSPRVSLVAVFPPETHDPIRYPAAVCKNGSPEAVGFLRFLRSIEMRQVFEQAGFRVMGEAGQSGSEGP